MTRSGYVEDCEHLALYRANVDRTIRGRRGQAFLREMAAALDALPVKELVAEDIVRDREHVCAIGSVALARKIDVSALDVTDGDLVGQTFGITSILAREIAYQNDENGPSGYTRRDISRERDETPAERWTRMRAWVDENLLKPEGEAR